MAVAFSDFAGYFNSTLRQIASERMPEPDQKAKWLIYARRLYDAGISIVAEADKMTVGAHLKDPKVLALALLSRTLSNFNGAIVMIDAALIVEARTLTRSCFENLLWLAELADKGAAFVDEMVRDEIASQQARGKIALSWSDRLESGASYEERLKERLEHLKDKYPNAKPIRFSDLGKADGVDDSYQAAIVRCRSSLSNISGKIFVEEPNRRNLTVGPTGPEAEGSRGHFTVRVPSVAGRMCGDLRDMPSP